jgi:REP element-mobilizing transposase RayT
MARRLQQEFQGEGFAKPEDQFGGSLLKNSHAKSKRPLSSKFPLHVVLRTHRSQFRLPKNYLRVNETIRKMCRKHGVRLYSYANVGNHLHLLVKLPHVRNWAGFARELAGRLAHLVQGLDSQERGGLFWKQRPFTRIVRGWKKAYRTVKEYIYLNELEAEGHIDRNETHSLKELRLFFADG